MGFLIADSRLLCLNVKKLEQNSKEGIYYINRLFSPQSAFMYAILNYMQCTLKSLWNL